MAPDYFNSLSGVWIDAQSKLFQYTSGMPEEVINAIQKEFKNIFESIQESILGLLSYEKIMASNGRNPKFPCKLECLYHCTFFIHASNYPN